MQTIPQRDLRNRSGEMLRLAASGEQLTITVDGRPVALLGPLPRRNWVGKAEYAEILRAGSTHDETFFADVAAAGGAFAELDEPWGRRDR